MTSGDSAILLAEPSIILTADHTMSVLKYSQHVITASKVLWRSGKQFWEAEEMLSSLHVGGYFSDQKTLVDMPLKLSLKHLEVGVTSVMEQTGGIFCAETMDSFILHHFDEAGSDLDVIIPENFEPTPETFICRYKNPEVLSWVLSIHSIWRDLYRRVSVKVQLHPEKHTVICLPKPMVVPGSRFREIYYWDSYWIIRGLIHSQLTVPAEDTLKNLMWMVKQYGFVPNGARTYYLNRSQPPLLSEMVRVIYSTSNNKKLLEDSLPLLLKEYRFWTSEPHSVKVCDHDGKTHLLSRYYAKWNKARPESFVQDSNSSRGLDPDSTSKLYREIATVAESGWDFSSRWMEDVKSCQSIRITSILPVDLNSFLHQMETNISFFASVLGNIDIFRDFEILALKRREAMDALMWNDQAGQWFDLWLPNEENGQPFQNKNVYASNFVPLWCGVLPKGDIRGQLVVESLKNSGLVLPGGISTSLINSGEQWDFPNAWAPLQHMIIEGLEKLELPEASDLAQDLASRFLNGAYQGFKLTGHMHEKYDARTPGSVGGGGEYEPQVGFGWTNGVVLSLLDKYDWNPLQN